MVGGLPEGVGGAGGGGKGGKIRTTVISNQYNFFKKHLRLQKEYGRVFQIRGRVKKVTSENGIFGEL